MRDKTTESKRIFLVKGEGAWETLFVQGLFNGVSRHSVNEALEEIGEPCIHDTAGREVVNDYVFVGEEDWDARFSEATGMRGAQARDALLTLINAVIWGSIDSFELALPNGKKVTGELWPGFVEFDAEMFAAIRHHCEGRFLDIPWTVKSEPN